MNATPSLLIEQIEKSVLTSDFKKIKELYTRAEKQEDFYRNLEEENFYRELEMNRIKFRPKRIIE